jgi:hypothetical protein
MTTPIGGNSELLDLAVPYALHALPEAEQRLSGTQVML